MDACIATGKCNCSNWHKDLRHAADHCSILPLHNCGKLGEGQISLKAFLSNIHSLDSAKEY